MSDARGHQPVEEAATEPGAALQARRHSVAGIISCALFGLVLVLVFVFRVIRPGAGVTGPGTGTIRLLQLVSLKVAFYAVLLGVVFGLFGMLQGGRRRGLAVAGLVLNGVPFLLVLVQVVARALS